MTSNVTHVTGLPSQNEQLYRASMSDLKNAISLTTQEMAQKRSSDYFAERACRAGGIINIYYHLRTVQAFDAAQTLEALSKDCPPKVQEDLTLLEKVKTNPNSVQEAIMVGFTKEVLRKIFDVATWQAFFPTESKAAQAIEEALRKIEQAEKRTEHVVKNVLQSSGVPQTQELKRKFEQVDKQVLPVPDSDEESLELAKKLFQEEQDALFAQQLAANEDRLDEDYESVRLAQLVADEEMARRQEAEDLALGINQALQSDE